jgi:hypothetical protein
VCRRIQRLQMVVYCSSKISFDFDTHPSAVPPTTVRKHTTDNGQEQEDETPEAEGAMFLGELLSEGLIDKSSHCQRGCHNDRSAEPSGPKSNKCRYFVWRDDSKKSPEPTPLR